MPQTMTDVVKRLSFGDLSKTLQLDHTAQLASGIMSLKQKYDDIFSEVDQKVQQNASIAVSRLSDTGGRTALESQLKSLKQSLRDFTQKEQFFQYLKNLPEGQDFAAEIQRAEAALSSVKEELSEVVEANEKSEKGIQEIIQHMSGIYDQFHAAAIRIKEKLANSAAELEAYHASKPAVPSPAAGVDTVRYDSALAEEDTMAAQLESKIAQALAAKSDLQAAVSAEEAEVAMLEAQVAELQAAQQDQAKEVDLQRERAIQWCDAVTAALTKLTGLSITSIQADALHLHLSQQIATSSASNAASSTTTVEHDLIIYLQPGTAQVLSAQLSPADVDISEDLKAVLDDPDTVRPAGLVRLLTAVRARIRAHYERELAIQEVSKHYPMQRIKDSSTVYRAVLPNTIEAELNVPLTWPKKVLDIPALMPNGGHEESLISLLSLHAPVANVQLAGVLEKMHDWQHQEGARGLIKMLDAVYADTSIVFRA